MNIQQVLDNFTKIGSTTLFEPLKQVLSIISLMVSFHTTWDSILYIIFLKDYLFSIIAYDESVFKKPLLFIRLKYSIE